MIVTINPLQLSAALRPVTGWPPARPGGDTTPAMTPAPRSLVGRFTNDAGDRRENRSSK